MIGFDWNKGRQLVEYVRHHCGRRCRAALGDATVHWCAWRGDLFLDQLQALAASPACLERLSPRAPRH